MSRAVEKRFRDLRRPGGRFPANIPSYPAHKRITPITLFLLTAVFFNVFSGEHRAQVLGNGPVQAGEKIHYGDLIDVDFIGSLEFDWRGRVTSEGFLDGLDRSEKPVFALCRTESEVAAEIAAQHKYFLRDPQVAVRIVDRSNRAQAYVTGAVRTAQRFQLRRSVSLLELIVLSGGITDSSNGEIVIFRPPNVSCDNEAGRPAASPETEKPKRVAIKLADLLAGKPDANPQVLIGDIVNVIEAPPVFLIGDVSSPRRVNLTPEMTLSRAIAYAGGVSRSFSGQKARIHRKNPEAKVLEFDLRRILEKKADDPKLEPYDVIDVEQRGFENRKIAQVQEPPAINTETMSRLPLRIVD